MVWMVISRLLRRIAATSSTVPLGRAMALGPIFLSLGSKDNKLQEQEKENHGLQWGVSNGLFWQ